MKPRVALVGFVLLADYAAAAYGYQANCGAGPTPIANATVISAFAEPRPDASPFTPVRFHSGVDVGQCSAGTNVYSILAGKRQSPTVCVSGSTCVRIRDSANHAFDYEHLNIDGSLPPVGSTTVIAAGTLLGTVLGGNTLHLQEAQSVPGAGFYRMNPQRPNALDFNHNAAGPSYTQASINGASNQSIILLPKSQFYPEGQQTNPTAFQSRNSVYYVKGLASVLIAASGGDGTTNGRKGLYSAGYTLQPPGRTPASFNISFMMVPDGATNLNDFWTVYQSSNPTGIVHFANNQKLNGVPYIESISDAWDTTAFSDGNVRVCGFIKDYPQGHVNQSACATAYVDNTPPTVTLSATGSNFTVATATPIVTVQGTDPGGINYITLTGPSYSSTSYSSGFQSSFSNQFPDSSVLADGQYTATVVNLAGNSASNSFTIDTSIPSGSNLNPSGAPFSTSTVNALVATATAPSGIASIAISCSGFSSTTTFNCISPAKVGPFYINNAGTCTITRTNCARKSTSENINVSTGSPTITLKGVGKSSTQSTTFSVSTGALIAGISTITITAGQFGAGIPAGYAATACLQAFTVAPGVSSGCQYFCPGGGAACYVLWKFVNSGSLAGESFTITNTTTSAVAFDISPTITVEASKPDGSGAGSGSISFSYTQLLNDGDSIAGTIQASPIGQVQQTISSGTASSSSTIAGVSVAQCIPAESLAQQLLDQLLASIMPGLNPYCWAGSEAVYVSSVPMNFSFQEPAGVVIDATTLGIYGYDIPSGQWTRSMAVNQSVSISSTGYVVATGSFTRTGSYGVYFVGHDSTAPVTTFTIQGSSYVFDQTSFVSTDSYIVLTATDPVVDGFASTVATITYCMDPSSGSVFAAYAAPVPVSLGTHVLQYRSIDYAGNVEVVKTATFTVTVGTVFRETSDDIVAGNLLVGFLGSGAQAEVIARAQDATTLQVSSVNRQSMVSVTNVGGVGIGVPAPAGQLDIAPASTALQLKSGNLTSTGTSVEMAFGYNGDVSMRHALRTFHSTATAGNEMDFLVWSPDAASTTTIPSKDLMALQAITTASNGSVHILPSGTPDVELEVSNGLTTGGGTMQRLQVLTPSSRRFKSDISYLKEKDEDRALEETAALKHVRYRYRSRARDGRLYDDPIQQVHAGLIYEDSPESIRGDGQTLLTNERLANVELALKAAMRKLEILEKRYKALKARKPR